MFKPSRSVGEGETRVFEFEKVLFARYFGDGNQNRENVFRVQKTVRTIFPPVNKYAAKYARSNVSAAIKYRRRTGAPGSVDTYNTIFVYCFPPPAVCRNSKFQTCVYPMMTVPFVKDLSRDE